MIFNDLQTDEEHYGEEHYENTSADAPSDAYSVTHAGLPPVAPVVHRYHKSSVKRCTLRSIWFHTTKVYLEPVSWAWDGHGII